MITVSKIASFLAAFSEAVKIRVTGKSNPSAEYRSGDNGTKRQQVQEASQPLQQQHRQKHTHMSPTQHSKEQRAIANMEHLSGKERTRMLVEHQEAFKKRVEEDFENEKRLEAQKNAAKQLKRQHEAAVQSTAVSAAAQQSHLCSSRQLSSRQWGKSTMTDA